MIDASMRAGMQGVDRNPHTTRTAFDRVDRSKDSPSAFIKQGRQPASVQQEKRATQQRRVCLDRRQLDAASRRGAAAKLEVSKRSWTHTALLPGLRRAGSIEWGLACGRCCSAVPPGRSIDCWIAWEGWLLTAAGTSRRHDGLALHAYTHRKPNQAGGRP